MEIRTVEVTRYIAPLREGGSLPAIAEADDGFMYSLKFRGAGQGTRALVAEMIGGMLAKEAGLKTPEIVFAELKEGFGRTEPDEEIQDLLKASTGLNIAIHYLSGSITYDPAVKTVDPLLASKIVWLDAFLMNVDRTPKNTNMLLWQKELWLIDHGACLYFHHNWDSWREAVTKPFVQIKDHVLLPQATEMEKADYELKQKITPDIIDKLISLIPANWINDYGEGIEPAAIRKGYAEFLKRRIENAEIFLNQILNDR